MSMPLSKAELRRRLRAKRDSLSKEEREALDRRICAHILASSVYRRADTLLLYAPHGSEINLLALVRAAERDGKRVAFPKCDTEHETMEFYYLEKGRALIPGAYGIPEPPADARLCHPDEHTLCILPALAVDLSGNRLGYGKGYYDKYLEHFTGITMVALYAGFLQQGLPAEKHDRPVQYLCTEDRIGRLRVPRALPHEESGDEEDTPSPKKTDFKGWLFAKNAEGKWAYPSSPLLILATYLLLLIARPLGRVLLQRENEELVVILLQLLLLLLPTLAFILLRSERSRKALRLHPFRPRHTWFCICTLVVMITGGLLFEILTGGVATRGTNFTLYDTFVARSNGRFGTTVYLLLAYCILPALSEELIFRALLVSDYEQHGFGLPVLLSGLFFALLHFDLRFFPAYLLIGCLLAGAMLVTGTFFVPLVLHVLYNVFCLYGQPYLTGFYNLAGSREIFIFLVGTIALLFAAFGAGEARKIFHVYARRGVTPPLREPLPLKELGRTLCSVLLTPAPLACLAVGGVASILYTIFG